MADEALSPPILAETHLIQAQPSSGSCGSDQFLKKGPTLCSRSSLMWPGAHSSGCHSPRLRGTFPTSDSWALGSETTHRLKLSCWKWSCSPPGNRCRPAVSVRAESPAWLTSGDERVSVRRLDLTCLTCPLGTFQKGGVPLTSVRPSHQLTEPLPLLYVLCPGFVPFLSPFLSAALGFPATSTKIFILHHTMSPMSELPLGS